MQTHNLKRKTPNKKSRQVGRGGTRGKTAGRGTKGQNARAGHKKRPEIRDFIKRLPKLRGRGKNINTSIELKPFVINLGQLESVFKAGDIVSPSTLGANKLVKKTKGAYPRIKILGNGALAIKLTVEGCAVSSTARTAIEKAGGVIK